MKEMDNYNKAFIELKEILKYLEDNIKSKIPNEIKKAIYDTKQSEYKFTYNKNIPLYEQPILEETKALLSIIYSDYLCSEEEREKWNEYDRFEQELYHKKLRQH